MSCTMKTAILHILTVIHFTSICGLALYGLHRIWLLHCWWKGDKTDKSSMPDLSVIEPLCCDMTDQPPETFLSFIDNFPAVTVQVPLYNEPLVAARIINAVAAFRWPAEKLEIQVLDDSSDETGQIVRERISYWSDRGISIYGICRKIRTGYKAGALQNGLNLSKGEFIAVFDADFIPDPDFLEKTVPHFYSDTGKDKLIENTSIHTKTIEAKSKEESISGNSIGMVQTRWGFLNSRYSWLTRLQTLLLSPHFGIEHKIRASRHLFFNFNGTAGIWRKRAIESAGGWQDDTVTEDLDLSYRTQLKGWKFLYLNDVVVPSELPVTLSDFRCQQERWSRGSIQTAVKILPSLLRAPISVAVKIEAIAHLMANFCWLLGFIVTITLYPVILYRIDIGIYQVLWIDLPLFFISSGAILTYYTVYSIVTRQINSLMALPILPIISIGLAPCFSISVLKGLFHKGGVFTRTPKFGLSDNLLTSGELTHGLSSSEPHSLLHNLRVNNLIINIPLFVYSLIPVIFTCQRETWPAVPFLSLFPLAFLVVVGIDIGSGLHLLIQKVSCSKAALPEDGCVAEKS